MGRLCFGTYASIFKSDQEPNSQKHNGIVVRLNTDNEEITNQKATPCDYGLYRSDLSDSEYPLQKIKMLQAPKNH